MSDDIEKKGRKNSPSVDVIGLILNRPQSSAWLRTTLTEALAHDDLEKTAAECALMAAALKHCVVEKETLARKARGDNVPFHIPSYLRVVE